MVKRILAAVLVIACLLPAMAFATKYDAYKAYNGDIATDGVIFKSGDKFTGGRGITVELYYADAEGNVVYRGNGTVKPVTVDGEKISEWYLTDKSGAMIVVGNMIYQATFGFTLQPTYAVADSEGYYPLQGNTYHLYSENATEKKVKFTGTVTEAVDDVFIVTIAENAAVAIKADQELATDDRVTAKGTIKEYYDYSGKSIPVLACNEVKVKLYDPLRKGDKGEDIMKMKKRLQELGYFTAGAELTDAYNDSCVERVKQFQQKNGLPGNGIIADEDTLTLLYSEEAVGK